MNIVQIQDRMQLGQITPQESAQMRVVLAGEYSRNSELLETILARKPAMWNELRKNFKSDKATDRAYEATQDGLDETSIRLRIKRLEKMMSALNTIIKVKEGESRNQW